MKFRSSALKLLGVFALTAVWWACGSDPTRPNPTCEFLADTLGFPVTAAGDTSTLTVQLASLSTEDQTICLRTGSSDFSTVGPDTGSTFVLAAQDTALVTVRFHPTSAGPKATQVRIEGAYGDPLVCKAAAEWDACVVKPLELAFGRVALGEEKRLPFLIRCTGPDTAKGRVEAACAEYVIASGGGPFSLAPGESLRVDVSYRPQTRGESNCTVTLGEGWCEPVECTGASFKTWRIFENGTGDAPTIQAGVDSAETGDTVLVAPGTYMESVVFRGKDIVLQGAGAELTTIDGSTSGSACVVFKEHESRACVLSGFRITGGVGYSSSFPGGDGGGIVMMDAEPTICDNTIEGNSAIRGGAAGQSGYGGGIAAGGTERGPTWHPLITRNIIRDNVAASGGGGLAFFGRVAPGILSNRIENNSVHPGDGGGILLLSRPPDESSIERNIVSGNWADDHGGGIVVGSAGPEIASCRIAENLIVDNVANGEGRTGTSGGGVFIQQANVILERNTIARNKAGPASYPGGVCLLGPGRVVIERNVFAYSAGIAVSCERDMVTSFECNLTWGNVPRDGYGQCSTWSGAGSNLHADPLFCTEDSYAVSADSPCLTGGCGVIGAIEASGCSEEGPGAVTELDNGGR